MWVHIWVDAGQGGGRGGGRGLSGKVNRGHMGKGTVVSNEPCLLPRMHCYNEAEAVCCLSNKKNTTQRWSCLQPTPSPSTAALMPLMMGGTICCRGLGTTSGLAPAAKPARRGSWVAAAAHLQGCTGREGKGRRGLGGGESAAVMGSSYNNWSSELLLLSAYAHTIITRVRACCCSVQTHE
jgi:hypothetical protein